MNLTALASKAVHTYLLAEGIVNAHQPLTPTMRKDALNRFKGICQAIDALGITMTDFAAEMDVREVVGTAPERPTYRPIDNSAQQAWYTDLADRLAARWA